MKTQLVYLNLHHQHPEQESRNALQYHQSEYQSVAQY